MRILVLSDLHIGNKSRSKELCPYPEGVYKDDKLVSDFILKAKEYQNEVGNFDFLIIPGDITNQSNLIEYDCGSKFLSKLVEELQIDKSKVLFVPGNHDIDWSVLEGKTIMAEEKLLRRTHKYNTLKDSSHLFSALACPDLVTAPFIKKWEYDNVVYFGFNSSWHDDAIEEKHFGLILPDQINDLRKKIEETDFTDKLKIFIIHHHLHQFPNPDPTWRDISIIQNAQTLLELLTEFEFNFVIHGHRHQPNFHSTSINKSKIINILCSGSYCCEMPTSIAGHIGNVFHILEIDNIQKCQGRILSYAYNPRDGWSEARDHDGIDHLNPFGNELTYDELLKNCTIEITQHFQTSSFILYSKLIAKIPDLKYLQLTQQKKLFEQLEIDCNLKKAVDSSQEVILINLGNE